MNYIPHSEDDKHKMLEAIGITSGNIDELFKGIPGELRTSSFDIPEGKSEFEVVKELKGLADKNGAGLITFAGGGAYDHFIPAAVDAIASLPEFYTAYTPYQPEASQGTLQAIFEYQSCICRLTGMDVSNASLYDGGTALYEAVMMAVRPTGKKKIIIDGGLNPIYRSILECHTEDLSLELVEAPLSDGRSDIKAIEACLDDDTAAIILQNPNFFGTIDDHTRIAEICHKAGALVIESVYPLSLGKLKTPGAMGADIVTGEGQSLGLPLSFGGPYLGFMAVKKDLVRSMPGRMVGETTDAEDKRSYVLTLQTREQHIRREKAISNICSNEALCALRALVYMCLIGEQGLKNVAELCMDKTEYARQKLGAVKGAEIKWEASVFNEFVLKLKSPADNIVNKLADKGFLAGIPLGKYYKDMKDCLLVTVTEKRTKEEIDSFAEALEDAL